MESAQVTQSPLRDVTSPTCGSKSPLRNSGITNALPRPATSEIKTLTPRRSPRKKRPAADDARLPLCPPIRIASPMRVPENEALNNPSAVLLEYQKPESPRSHKVRVIVGGSQFLEYQEPHREPHQESSVKRVTVVYSSSGAVEKTSNTRRPAIPPFKSILRRSGSAGSGTQQQSPHTSKGGEPAYSIQGINYRMSILFPRQYGQILQMPCDVARLIACYTLYQDELSSQLEDSKVESDPKSPLKKKTRSLKLSMDSKTPGKTAIQPILPFLTALVDLELAHFSKASQQASQKKRVHFPAYNGSALQPPSDVIEGSDQLREDCINQLTTVVELGKAIVAEETQKKALDKLVPYLNQEFVSQQGHVLACSNSFPAQCYYPPARVAKAAKSYARDLKRILSQNKDEPCSWERRLSDNAAQQIRYWLRTLLNPVPDRAPSYHHSKNWNFRVCDIVALEVLEGGESTVVEDGSLSSLVSDAFSFLYEFFGTHCLKAYESTSTSMPENKLPHHFCSTVVSLKESFISPQQWNRVEEQMGQATRFLAAMNGARFLQQLFEIILKKTKYNGLWKQYIQESASRFPLSGAQPEDAHLVLLQYSLQEWVPVLKNISRVLSKQRHDCLSALQKLEGTLLFGRKASKRKRWHMSSLKPLEARHQEIMEKITFPQAKLA